jgi:hypothetical protein
VAKPNCCANWTSDVGKSLVKGQDIGVRGLKEQRAQAINNGVGHFVSDDVMR